MRNRNIRAIGVNAAAREAGVSSTHISEVVRGRRNATKKVQEAIDRHVSIQRLTKIKKKKFRIHRNNSN